METIIISIDYDEENANTSYRGVELRIQGKETTVINTGDPVADFDTALDQVAGERWVMLSSSCDHFTQDRDNIGWYTDEHGTERLKWIDETKKLVSISDLIEEYQGLQRMHWQLSNESVNADERLFSRGFVRAMDQVIVALKLLEQQQKK